MLNSLKLVYKSFYDKSFVKDYINNGKGEGVLPLGLVALITSLIVSVSLFFIIKTNINQETIESAVSQIKRTIPTIAIDKGQLVWEDGVINEFYFSDGAVKLIVDTKNEIVGVNQIKNSHFYLTKTYLYINNNNQIKDFELKNINVIANSDYVDLTSETTLSGLVNMLLLVLDIVIAVLFVVLFLGSWVVNCFLCKLTRFFAKLAFKDLKELKYDVLERAITVSIIPALLVIDSITSFTGTPGWIVRWIAIIAFGIFVAKKHLSEPAVKA